MAGRVMDEHDDVVLNMPSYDEESTSVSDASTSLVPGAQRGPPPLYGHGRGGRGGVGGRRVKQRLVYDRSDDIHPDMGDPNFKKGPLPTGNIELLQLIAKRLEPLEKLHVIEKRLRWVEVVTVANLMLFLILIAVAGASLKQADDFLRDMKETGVAPLIGQLVDTWQTKWQPELNVTIDYGTSMVVTLRDLLLATNVPELKSTLNMLSGSLHNLTVHWQEQIAAGNGIPVSILGG